MTNLQDPLAAPCEESLLRIPQPDPKLLALMHCYVLIVYVLVCQLHEKNRVRCSPYYLLKREVC